VYNKTTAGSMRKATVRLRRDVTAEVTVQVVKEE